VSTYALWIAIASGLLSGFFSAAHQALLDFSPSRLADLLRERNVTRRGRILDHREDLLLLTAILRGVLNLTVLVMMLAWLTPPTQQQNWWLFAYAFLAAGAIIVLFSVAIPISWARHAAEPLLLTALPVLHACWLVCQPVLFVLRWLDPAVRRVLGVAKPEDDDRSPLEQEILDAVTEGEKSGLVDESQKEMIEAVVEFPTIDCDEIMTPRTDILGIDVDSTMEQVKHIIAEAGHSRYPVYQGDLDHIVGVLYAKDLLQFVGSNGDHPFDLRQVVREALFVPETKSLRDLLNELQANRVHIAIVLDEYGGTAGLITIEDIIEEIVGEIEDEYDTEDDGGPELRRTHPNIAEVDARMHIDDVNDELGIELPEDEDYDTLGGFVFSTLGHIPSIGEAFDYDNVRITVTDAEKTKVIRLTIERTDGAHESGENHSAHAAG
jgi:putative hemolysin